MHERERESDREHGSLGKWYDMEHPPNETFHNINLNLTSS